jgi:hypothetical protein
MAKSYFVFPSIEQANACSIAVQLLARPYRHFQNDVASRAFPSIELLDGSGALVLDLEANVVIHKDGIDPVDPFGKGCVAVLLRNFAGMPTEEEMAGWMQLVTALAALPERGDPILEGMEPVISVPLGLLMPASALAQLKTEAELIDLGLLPGSPEEPE